MQHAPSSQGPGHAGRIVHIIDDDDAVRDSLNALLESHAIAFRAYDSAEAFLAEGGAACTGCVLVDVHMPGLTGLELLELLATRNPDVPVIVMTGRSDGPLRERALRAGAVAVLEKPLRYPALFSAMDAAFSGRASR